MRHFYLSHIVTVIGLLLAYLWAGWQGLAIAALLTVLEISLSFDNAVVNATVLRDMSEKWQQRFLTWGILVAVFFMRLIFPVMIVAFATGLGFFEVKEMAFTDPETYSQHVLASHIHIASFGGMFLLMVFLKFILNETKELHWIGIIERRLSRVGKLESFEVVVALSILLAMQLAFPAHQQQASLMSGVIGVVLYVMINSLTALFSVDRMNIEKTAASSGLMAFIYLQFLDASFSLDGVIGAFAISKDVVIIMLGLGIGAMFVRSLTVYLVRKGTLNDYVYLEHGAHYGIGALAVIMLVSTVHHVPEVVTGLIGVSFISMAFLSSVKYKRKLEKQ